MIEIRACRTEDAAFVSALLGELGYMVSTEQAAEQLRRLADTGCDAIFLAATSDQVIGLLASHLCQMLHYAKPVMRVTALVVDPRARRRGVGKLLMEHAEQIAAAAGCEFVELTSAMDRGEAHAFYRSIGYDANSLRFRKSAARR